jgi:hypothetical protein
MGLLLFLCLLSRVAVADADYRLGPEEKRAVVAAARASSLVEFPEGVAIGGGSASRVCLELCKSTSVCNAALLVVLEPWPTCFLLTEVPAEMLLLGVRPVSMTPIRTAAAICASIMTAGLLTSPLGLVGLLCAASMESNSTSLTVI